MSEAKIVQISTAVLPDGTPPSTNDRPWLFGLRENGEVVIWNWLKNHWDLIQDAEV